MANKIKASNIDTNAITADSISYPLTTFSSTGIDDNATSTAITIDSSQNVGIGTTNPSSGGGLLNLETSSSSLVNYNSTNADGGFIKFQRSGTTKGYVGIPQSFVGGGDADDLGVRAQADFTIATGGTNERMRIDSSGNVGIGTSSPAPAVGTDKVLEISGSVSPGLVINDTGQAQKYQLYADSTKFKMSYGSTGFFTYDASNGNLGIGTVSPATKLDVFGPSSVTSFTGTSRLGLTVRGSSAATDYSGIDFIGNNQVNPIARIGVLTTGSGALLSFGTSNSYGSGITNTAMTIDQGGNLLIGTTSPSAGERLGVYSPNTTNATFLFNFTNGNGVVFQAENSGRFKTGTQSQSPYNYAVTGRDVYVSSAGLIGYLSSIRDSKTNIENISDVSWLYQLNPVSFNYKVQDEQGNYTEEAETDKFYGLIAEEVEPINSDICFYKNNNPEDGLAGVDYKKLYAPMIKALQEQQTKIQELEARITALENN